MASRGNYYSDLLDEVEEEPTEKKQQKQQKLNDALAQQKRSGKAKQQKQDKAPAKHYEPTVDATRPEKRQFDRHVSGTGRGKEVRKDGLNGWGETLNKQEISDATHEVLVEEKMEKKDQPKKDEKKPSEHNEEKPKEEKPQEEKKKLYTLDQYTSHINTDIIRLEERKQTAINENCNVDMSQYVMLHDRTDQPRTTEFIPIKPAKKPAQKNAPKPQPKTQPKPQPKPAAQQQKGGKKDNKAEQKDNKKGNKKDQKDQKKQPEKKEEPKKEAQPVPQPTEGKKKEKRPEDMTTADFFARGPRQQTFQPREHRERREREPREPRNNGPLTVQVWRREGNKELTEQRVIAEAPAPAGRFEQASGRPRRDGYKAGNRDFPDLPQKAQPKKQEAPKQEAPASN